MRKHKKISLTNSWPRPPNKLLAIRMVAGLLGLLGNFYLTMGPVSRFHSRGLMTCVASQVQSLGWYGWAVLDAKSRIKLSFWNDNIQSLNGALMRTEVVVRDLDVRDLVSDAGSMLVGASEFRGGVEDVSMRLQEPLEEADLGESSTFCELRTLKMALQARGQSLRGQSALGRGFAVRRHYSHGGQHEA